MTLKVGNRIPDADVSPCFAPIGIMCGCEVVADFGLTLSVNPGKLNFANGYSAEITHKISPAIRIVPPDTKKSYDFIVWPNKKDLGFSLIENNDEIHAGYRMSDLSWPMGGIRLARIVVVPPCIGKESIFVYNTLPAKGEQTISSFRPLSYPDGERKVFKMGVKINVEFGCRVVCAGIPQDEFIDYTLGTWIGEDGEEYSSIVFTDAPGNGIDIIVKTYIGKIRLVE